ncbi:TolC family protein [Echinicola sediminis]
MACFNGRAQGLEEYLRLAAENNPALKASYARYSASLERVPQVGSLPDPELSFGFYLRDMATLMGDQKLNATIMQRFPWFGKLQASRDEASLMAVANFQEFEAAKYNLFYEVKAAYYQLYLLHHHAQIAQENLRLLRSLERLTLNKFKGGTPGEGGKMTDVLRVQSQLKEMETLLEQYEDDQSVERIKFNLLLNRPEESPVHMDTAFLDKELLLAKELVLDSIFSANPQLKMLEAEGAAFQKKGEAARLSGRPSFGLGLNYMVNSSRMPSGSIGSEMGYRPGGMGHNMVMPMVSLSLPIYRGQYKAAQRESARYWEAADYQKESLLNDLKVQWEKLYGEIREAERNRKLFGEQVVLLKKTYDLMIADYSNATGSFEELLTVQRQLLDFEMKMAEETVRKLSAIAKLETLMAKAI